MKFCNGAWVCCRICQLSESLQSHQQVLIPQRLKFLEQRPIEVVIATQQQLRVDAAVFVSRIRLGAYLPGGVLPMLELLLADLLLQLLVGLLQGQAGAVAHLNGGAARALNLG